MAGVAAAMEWSMHATEAIAPGTRASCVPAVVWPHHCHAMPLPNSRLAELHTLRPCRFVTCISQVSLCQFGRWGIGRLHGSMPHRCSGAECCVSDQSCVDLAGRWHRLAARLQVEAAPGVSEQHVPHQGRQRHHAAAKSP